MKKLMSILLVMVMTIMPGANAFAAENPFSDVKSGDWFADSVAWAVENNITKGTSDSTFSPDQVCTRGQIVTFLWRSAGQPAPTKTDNPFTDVKSGDYFYNAVLWAVEKGITAGATAATFAPDSYCTREQAVTFMHRAQGSPAVVTSENPFTDVKSDAYSFKPILWAVENGITQGTGTGTFSPQQNCTRAQIVTFLYRLKSKTPSSAYEYLAERIVKEGQFGNGWYGLTLDYSETDLGVAEKSTTISVAYDPDEDYMVAYSAMYVKSGERQEFGETSLVIDKNMNISRPSVFRYVDSDDMPYRGQGYIHPETFKRNTGLYDYEYNGKAEDAGIIQLIHEQELKNLIDVIGRNAFVGTDLTLADLGFKSFQ